MTPPLRIIFMGTPDFAVASLQALLAGPDEVVAVISQPDKPKGRGKKLSPTPVKTLAAAHGIPVLQPLKIRTEAFRDELLAFRPDLVVVAAYGRILPPSLLHLAPFGAINVHGSLLPRHRGAAPVQWAIITGDREVGVTIIQMDEGMDTGDILLADAMEADPDETAGSLFVKLAELGGRTLRRAIDRLKTGDLPPTPQDHSRATAAPMLKKEDGIIDWSLPAERLHCLIRGLDPWPAAACRIGGQRCNLFSPEVIHKDSAAAPGTLVAADREGLLIATGYNLLLIREIQPEGRKRMAVSAFLCGHPLAVGTLLAS
ncbi:methionyl-tRNA formyltransferase [Desulfobulbus sp. Tol-SR]|nr:methionyl-tRNA formyltransferase [Desulfobulbus sp. Tol-SR]